MWWTTLAWFAVLTRVHCLTVLLQESVTAWFRAHCLLSASTLTVHTSVRMSIFAARPSTCGMLLLSPSQQ